MHPNSLKNLTMGPRIKPGQVLNPHGPPKARVQLMQWVRKFMEDMTLDQVEAYEPQTTSQTTAKAMVLKAAKKCDWQIIKELLDRDEGRPAETVNMNQTVSMSPQEAKTILDEVNGRN